jgi:hypothetical protein
MRHYFFSGLVGSRRPGEQFGGKKIGITDKLFHPLIFIEPQGWIAVHLSGRQSISL